MDNEVGRASGVAVGDGCVPVVELDELHSYVQPKKHRWIWTAVDRLAGKHIAFVCGDRSGSTGSKLKEEIRHLTEERFFSDHWKAYAETFPADRLKQTKPKPAPSRATIA